MIFKATLFSFAAVLTLATVSVADKHGNIHGHYILDSDLKHENVMKFLDAMGFPEMIKKGVAGTKKLLAVIDRVNDTHCTAKILTKDMSFDSTFESGKEYNAELPDGRTVKSIITIDHEKQTVRRLYKMDGFEATCDAKFCDGGFETTLKAKDAVAVVKFKRFTQSMCKDGDIGDIEAVKKSYFGE